MNRNKKPLVRHAANEYGGWVDIVIRFRLSHKPQHASFNFYVCVGSPWRRAYP